jgi:hypothetical protein
VDSTAVCGLILALLAKSTVFSLSIVTSEDDAIRLPIETAAGTRSSIPENEVEDKVAVFLAGTSGTSLEAMESPNSALPDGSSSVGVLERLPNLLNLDKPFSNSNKMR